MRGLGPATGSMVQKAHFATHITLTRDKRSVSGREPQDQAPAPGFPGWAAENKAAATTCYRPPLRTDRKASEWYWADPGECQAVSNQWHQAFSSHLWSFHTLTFSSRKPLLFHGLFVQPSDQPPASASGMTNVWAGRDRLSVRFRWPAGGPTRSRCARALDLYLS